VTSDKNNTQNNNQVANWPPKLVLGDMTLQLALVFL
jgi:hypothetical protein